MDQKQEPVNKVLLAQRVLQERILITNNLIQNEAK